MVGGCRESGRPCDGQGMEDKWGLFWGEIGRWVDGLRRHGAAQCSAAQRSAVHLNRLAPYSSSVSYAVMRSKPVLASTIKQARYRISLARGHLI